MSQRRELESSILEVTIFRYICSNGDNINDKLGISGRSNSQVFNPVGIPFFFFQEKKHFEKKRGNFLKKICERYCMLALVFSS